MCFNKPIKTFSPYRYRGTSPDFVLTFDAALEKRMQEARKANYPGNPQTHEDMEDILRNTNYGFVHF